MARKQPQDYILLLSVGVLVVIGIIMVFSSSYSYSLVKMNDGYYYLKRVLIWAVVGTFTMVSFSKINYRNWSKYANLIFVISIILLILVLTPLGIVRNDARRWLGAGKTLTFMPSDVAKLASIIFISTSISRKKEKMRNFVQGFLPYLLIMALYFGLIFKQPDFSTAFVLVVMIFIMVFVGGMKFSHFIALATGGLLGLAGMLTLIFFTGKDYKAKRITAFLDPWQDSSDTGYQVIQSLLALGSGGIFGRGLGRSVQKHFYLPEPQNDFIFAIIGEELGFIGGAIVIILYAILIWRGIRIAINAPDVLGCVMATGVIAMIAVQVIINIAVATSSMPVTGMGLPFISYGGSSLVVFMASIGILLNISKHISLDRS
ncbi:MAG TPA: putative lipid II flippase FtsW [Clostridia bacterium]|nr:putative lipid II flippase FtsW [Clostridia bacterium]